MDAPKIYVDGQWLDSGTNGHFECLNPATGQTLYRAPAAGVTETAAAVTAAKSGLKQLRRTTPHDKMQILAGAARRLRENKAEIAELLRLETGKTDALANAEVELAAGQFDWYSSEAMRVFERSAVARHPDFRYRVALEPVGIVAAFTAWNFPLLLAARKFAPAIAAGCSMIIRPAEQGTRTIQTMVEISLQSGLPDKAVALLNGPHEPISRVIMESTDVRKLTFTGSTAVGKLLFSQAAKTMKKMSLELGGSCPVIVDHSAEIASLIAPLTQLKFRNAGQVCTSPTRFIVHESIFDEFTQGFVNEAKKLKLGDPSEDSDVDIGPLISERRVREVHRLVKDAVDKGADLLLGGQPSTRKRGFFYDATVLANVPDDCEILSGEPFGPVALINPYSSDEEAVDAANSTEYGLASYVYCQDHARSNYFVDNIDSGVVALNQYFPALPEGPMGGRKSSGFGSEGGTEGIAEYLVPKFIHYAVE